jgi:hypothetical protein
MFDSIHLSRWLSQFKDQEIEFLLFPSKKFKYIDFELSELFQSKNVANFSVAKPYFYFKYLGFVDFILCFLFRKIKVDIKRLLLRYCLSANSFKYVHAIEIQGAGYLYASLPKTILDRNTLILTNYGSDVIFYRNFPEHRIKINSVLSIAKLYSAECQRDYEIALSMGFVGKFLPCIPNAGGFTDNTFDLNVTPSEERNLIVAKCYGGIFGLGESIIEALSTFLVGKTHIKVIIHSVTKDLFEKSNKLLEDFPGQVIVYNTSKKIPRNELLKDISNAKIYIGASRSDGISTSFLEAICLGAYPIQTNSSCANEWIARGFVGTLINLENESILEALNVAYFDENLEIIRRENLKNAKKYLAFELVKSQAIKFYETNH